VLDVLRQVLPAYVLRQIGDDRRKPIDLSGVEDLPTSPVDESVPPAPPIEDPEPIEDPNPVIEDQPPPGPRLYESKDGRKWLSPKLRASADAYAALLDKQYGTEKGLRRLGNMTIADIEWAASERRKQAAGQLVEAARLDSLRDALTRYQKTTVNDLPPVVVVEIMERAS